MKRYFVAIACVVSMSGAAWAQRPRLPFPLRGVPAEPTPAEREYTAGERMLRDGDVDGARARFESARRLDPRDARPVLYLGVVERQQGHLPQAEALFREASRLSPTLAEAQAELGATLREAGRLPDAVAALRAAVQRSPTLGEAQYTLGLALEDTGAYPEAADAYRSAARSLHDDPMPSLNLGLLLEGPHAPPGAGHHEALAALREAIRRAPRQREVLVSAGPALRRLGDAAGAVTALQTARGLGAPTASLLAELCQALWAANRRDEAFRTLDAALMLAPQDAPLQYIAGLMRAGAGETARAREHFRAAMASTSDADLRARSEARLRQLEAPARR